MPSLKIKSLGIKTKTFMINNSLSKKIIDIFNKSLNKPLQFKNKKYSNFKPIFSIKQKKLLCQKKSKLKTTFSKAKIKDCILQ